MHQIQVTEHLYKELERRAAQAGFARVHDYLAQVVSQNSSDAAEDFDHLFTPERLAHLDRVSAEIRGGGKTYTASEVHDHFEKKRKRWLKDHAN